MLFRDHDFPDVGTGAQRDFFHHFGMLYVPQYGGQVEEVPEPLPVCHDLTAGIVDNELKNNVSNIK